MVSMTLTYTGALADNNSLDMYDAARALLGFQRSLALTTHLIINGEIITQAPSLKNAEIISFTPEPGSWKVTAVIVAGLFASVTASKDTPFGHMMYSAYDYVIKSTLGFHVDFDKSLGQSYDQYLLEKKITEEKFNSLLEKTESAISDLHRPIVGSKTAQEASIVANFEAENPKSVGPILTCQTYDYLSTNVRPKEVLDIVGVVSSFNINTYKGRLYSFEEQRPIPFELSEDARTVNNLIAITNSLRANASNRFSDNAVISFRSKRLESSTGRLKFVIVESVGSSSLEGI